MTAVESRQITVNGLPAIAMVADQPQQTQGQVLRTLSYLIQYNGAIYHLIGVSMLNDFNSYQQTFVNSFGNFRPLTDPAKLNKKPERIRIKTIRTNGTLSAALRDLGVPERRLEELSLVNGMRLTDNVTSGMLIKVVGE
jgi:predicted Zn-dependent protease